MFSENYKYELAVIAPTRNESENIKPFLERLTKTLSGIRYQVVFVDDSSDNTPHIIKKFCQDNIFLIHRPPEERNGLGNAVVRGFKEAKDCRYLAALNVDLQHPPEILKKLYDQALISGADLVLPSRFIKGGGAEGLANPYRQLVAWGFRTGVRLIFWSRLKHVTDPASGMYLLKRQVIKDVELKPIGFKILLEILIKGRWSRTSEIPYVFEKRLSGVSKAKFSRGIDFLQHLWKLFIYFYFTPRH